jgi:oligo-1,6-glucosidase
MQKKWWMESVGYQIYPKSFFDRNDDGIGDLGGIYQKLEYLKDLGVTLIWICPFYDSPMDDNGYDVRDFYKVSEQFGTMEDLKNIIDKAHRLDIKVILDFVLNHTSDEHPWFIQSKSSQNNPYRDFYIWKAPRYVQGIPYPPNNWASFFGGSAWAYDAHTESYYMKIFSNKMPDLNWENKDVREAMKNVARFYLDMGIDGFRIDAVSHLDRGDFKDADGPFDQVVMDWRKFSNLPKIHEHLKELRKDVFEPYQAFTIGEVGGEAAIEEALKFAAFGSKELDTVFNFDHNWCNHLWALDDYKDMKTDVVCLKKAFYKWQEAFKDEGWLPLNWLNHDQPRLMSHYGSKAFPLESAKMLATSIHLMRGTPFIYQGEEIGMTNYPFEDIHEFNDVSTITHYHQKLIEQPDKDPKDILKKVAMTSRDHPRTPMQWSNEIHAGFSKQSPYMKVNPNYVEINAENQINDTNSLWHHYRKLIELRRKSPYQQLILYGSYEIIDIYHPTLYTYIRRVDDQVLLVINSFDQNPQTYDLKTYDIIDVVIHNYDIPNITNNQIQLRPFESIALYVKEHI